MKLSQMFIGQIVMDIEQKDSRIPKVGTVVDIALQYDSEIIIDFGSKGKIPVVPVIHYVGEQFARKVNPANVKPYKE
jgi:hypothetical protein